MKEIIQTEICIVGAGPAGTITSLMLAKQGIKSVLVDKETFPRHKPCADCITGNTLRILNEIDPSLLKDLKLNKEVIEMKGIIANTSNGGQIKIEFKSLEADTDEASCLGITRIDFDNHLINLAKKNSLISVIENFNIQNIEQKNNQALVTNKEGKQVIAKVVVLATGSNSMLNTNLAKIDRNKYHTAVGVRGYYSGVTLPDENYCHIFLKRQLMPGGIYVTPLPNGLVNINITARKDKIKHKQLDLKQIMEEQIQQNPLLKEWFANAKLEKPLEGSMLTLGTRKHKIYGDNFILVGDAAGLIDLISANGLPQAFMSAKIAAKHLANAIQTQNFTANNLKAYGKEVQKATKNYLKLSRLTNPFYRFDFVLNFIDKFLNFVAQRKTNGGIEELVYSKNVYLSLINPQTYRKFFFGLKNSESV